MLTRAPFPGNGTDFNTTGSTNDLIATHGQDRYIRVFRLQNRTVAASTTATEYLNCGESAHKHSATGFDSMALDPEGRWCNRLRCCTLRNWRRIWLSDESRFLLQIYGYIGTEMNVSLPLVVRKWIASVEVVSQLTTKQT